MTFYLPDTINFSSGAKTASVGFYNYYPAHAYNEVYDPSDTANQVLSKVMNLLESDWDDIEFEDPVNRTGGYYTLPASRTAAFRARFGDISRVRNGDETLSVKFTLREKGGSGVWNNTGSVFIDSDDQVGCKIDGVITSSSYNNDSKVGTLKLSFTRSYSSGTGSWIDLPASFEYWDSANKIAHLGVIDNVTYTGGATKLQITGDTAWITGTYTVATDRDALFLSAEKVHYWNDTQDPNGGTTKIEGPAYAGGFLLPASLTRDYTISASRMNVGFALTNSSPDTTMMVELPASIYVQNYSQATGKSVSLAGYSKTDTTVCKVLSNNNESCSSRIMNTSGNYGFSPVCKNCQYAEIAPNETLRFTTSTVNVSELSDYLSTDSVKIKTALRYMTENKKRQQSASFGWSNETDSASSSGPLTFVSGSAASSYQLCDANKTVKFSFSLKNNENTAVVTSPSSYRFATDSAYYSPVYSACVNDRSSCISNLDHISVDAGKTLNLTGTFTTAGMLTANTFVYYVSSTANSLNFPVTASAAGGSCTGVTPAPTSVVTATPVPQVTPTSAVTGELTCTGSGTSNGSVIRLTLTCTNASKTITIVPEKITLSGGNTNAVSYSGTVAGGNQKGSLDLAEGSAYQVPAGDALSINADVTMDGTGLSGAQTLSWQFHTDGNPEVYTAVIPVAAKSTSTVTSGDDFYIGYSDFFPYFAGDLKAPGENMVLPGTGFPSGKITILPSQPLGLAYPDLNMRLEIPVLDEAMDVVGVPAKENSWAVDWLGERAGVLEGSQKPGEGITVIAAHDHLNTNSAGPFAFLNALKENDRIFVSENDGTLLQFRVTENELVEPDDIAAVNRGAVRGSLVLVTCENESVEGGYLNRRIVHAEPVLQN